MNPSAHDVARDLLPAAPPASVATMTYMGIQLSDWVLLLTLVYTVVQIVIALPKAVSVVRKWWQR